MDHLENEHLDNSQSCNCCSSLSFIIVFDKDSTFMHVCKALCTNAAIHIKKRVAAMILISLAFLLNGSIQKSKYAKIFFFDKTVELNPFVLNEYVSFL